MHEDLLGYLLGALEPHEMRRVEEILRNDAAAREELDRLERMLRPLEDARVAEELPPHDLVSRTLENLPPLPIPPSNGSELDENAGLRGTTNPVTLRGGGLRPMGDQVESVGRSSFGWLDWVAASVAAVILLGLLLPSVAEGRFQARKIACQDQLRELGTAITQFVVRDEQERLPPVAEQGPEAFAGVYAVRLYDAGLIADPTIRWCPSLNRPDVVAGGHVPPILHATALHDPAQLVSLDALRRASINELQVLQRLAGGHYTYTLGVHEGNRYAAPRYQSRASFAVMSDAPVGGFPADGVLTSERVGHSGRGINILYEDGRVDFIPVASVGVLPDHPLVNFRGEVEAGVHIDDAVLAPSWRAPFVDAPQR